MKRETISLQKSTDRTTGVSWWTAYATGERRTEAWQADVAKADAILNPSQSHRPFPRGGVFPRPKDGQLR